MKTLFRNIRIVDPLSPRNGEILDLLFDNGKILLNGEECSTIIEAEGWSVSPGRVDLKSDIGEPGNEEAESYSSFAEAAQAGGYVAACTTPLRLPVTDSAPAVANLIQKSVGGKVRLMPIAAATKGGLGKELSEYFDLRNAGAVMVSDDTRLLNHSHLIKV
ncbi:MAG: hypothetical protein KDC37_04090, partial [Flavobacteriales bacterium]|nr:hypothetical protein [Flavobacteriales bacterium]